MKKALLLFAMLFVAIGFSQTEKEVANNFKDAFNSLNNEAIYKLFSKKKKVEFSLERTKTSFERLHNSFGDLKTLTFIKTENKARHVYKAVFTKREGELLVTLNKKGKADELSVRVPQKINRQQK